MQSFVLFYFIFFIDKGVVTERILPSHNKEKLTNTLLLVRLVLIYFSNLDVTCLRYV